MGKYLVTQAMWESVMGSNPSNFKGADRPVEEVSWNDVQDFLQRMNAKNDGYRYRLPTEAEWEYAARAGSTSARYGELDAVAWYERQLRFTNSPGGAKAAECLGTVRHAGQRVGVGAGLLRRELLPTIAGHRPAGAFLRAVSRIARRFLAQRCQVRSRSFASGPTRYPLQPYWVPLCSGSEMIS